MGLFSALFGSAKNKRVTINPEVIWLTEYAKLNGIKQDLSKRSSGDAVAVLLISHFPDAHQQLASVAESCEGTVPVMPVLARDLSSQIASQFEADESSYIELIVAERHPLTEEDDRVLENFANDLNCRCRVTYHISLDDGLMQMFVGDFVRDLMKRLGMKEDEKIQSSLLSKRVRQAQKKITETATGNRTADSQSEWMELNMPNQT